MTEATLMNALTASFNNLNNTITQDRQNAIVSYLTQYGGFSRNAAIGLLGIIEQESGTIPGRINQAEAAGKNPNVQANQAGIGLIQWTGSRRKNYDAFMESRGIDPRSATLKDELDFMIQEVDSNSALKTLLNESETEYDALARAYLAYVSGAKSAKSLLGKSSEEINKYAVDRGEYAAKKLSKMFNNNQSNTFMRRVNSLTNIIKGIQEVVPQQRTLVAPKKIEWTPVDNILTGDAHYGTDAGKGKEIALPEDDIAPSVVLAESPVLTRSSRSYGAPVINGFGGVYNPS